MSNKYAIVVDGVVQTIAKAEPEFAQEQGWIEAPQGVSKGWLFDGSAFSAPSLPPAYPTAQSAKSAILNWINALTTQITDQYPAAEVASWPSKNDAARLVVAGTARADQEKMVQDEADLRGRSLQDQAAHIVAKADAYQGIISATSGLRQKTEAAIDAASTPEEWEAIINAALAQAAPLLAAHGLS